MKNRADKPGLVSMFTAPNLTCLYVLFAMD